MSLIDDGYRDLRYAWRLLRTSPIASATACLSIAIALGAATTVFTIASALLLRTPAAVVDPHRLVDIGSVRGPVAFGNSSYPNYADLRDRTTTLGGVYAYSLLPRAMSFRLAGANAGAERVFGTYASTNYFKTLGAVPAAGTLFEPRSDDRSGAAPIVVLSHRFWTRRFNNDPSIVGRTVEMNGRPLTVAGIAAEGFQGTGVRASDLWIPLGMIDDAAALANRASAWLLVGGRLNGAVTRQEAAAEVDAIGRALSVEYPDENRGLRLKTRPASALPGADGIVAAFLALLMAIALVVLAISSANIAGVMLARTAMRRREIAVRLALGAGRLRLARQLAAETTALFAIGTGVGLLFARFFTSAIVSSLPALPFPVEVRLTIDGRTLGFALALGVITALLSTIGPALQAVKSDVVSALNGDAYAPGRMRLRRLFVMAQVGLSVVLVVVAGLFVRALERAGSTDPGFDARDVEVASLDLSTSSMASQAGPRFSRELIERLRALPDVQTATVAASVPGGFEVQRKSLSVPGAVPPNGDRFFTVDWNIVEPAYFAALRIPLAAGRDFTQADRDGTESVTIVSEGAARLFWPGAAPQDAIGKSVEQPALGPRGRINSTRRLAVVGVARDVKSTTLVDGMGRSVVYVPMQQQYTARLMLVARTAPGRRVSEQIRALIASMDSGLPIASPQTLSEAIRLGFAPQRIAASLSGSLAFVGLLLASIGVYGLTAYLVECRTREFGIRMALGATNRNIVGMVFRDGVRLSTIGGFAGLALAAAVARGIEAFLYGADALDAGVFGGVTLLFVAIGIIASFAPARRAVRVPPLVALRRD